MTFTVRDLMSPVVAQVEADTPLTEVVRVILEQGTSEAYVVDSQQSLLGILTDYEILKAQLTGDLHELTAREIMSCQVETAEMGHRLHDVSVRLRSGFVGRIAILQEGRLMGVVTRHNVMRLLAALESTTHPEVTDEQYTAEIIDGELAAEQPHDIDIETASIDERVAAEEPSPASHAAAADSLQEPVEQPTPVRRPAFLRQARPSHLNFVPVGVPLSDRR